MRMLLLTIAVLAAGCAAGPEGRQAKNGEPLVYERLGTVTSEELPGSSSCSRRHMKWCSVEGGRYGCQCVLKHSVRMRVNDMVDRMRRMPDPYN